MIVDVTEGKYGRPDLEFDDGTKLSLNATNNRTLVTAYGGKSDDWLNKEIELSIGEVEYQGELQESIVIKPISPPIEKKPTAEAEEPRRRRHGRRDSVLIVNERESGFSRPALSHFRF